MEAQVEAAEDAVWLRVPDRGVEPRARRWWLIRAVIRVAIIVGSLGPIERLMGLATLAVTRASAHGAIYIVGLDQRVAAEAAQHLTQITQLTEGDQT